MSQLKFNHEEEDTHIACGINKNKVASFQARIGAIMISQDLCFSELVELVENQLNDDEIKRITSYLISSEIYLVVRDHLSNKFQEMFN